MSDVRDLTGKRYGRLTVIGVKPDTPRGGRSRWLCRCECGREVIYSAYALESGKVASCGCLRRERDALAAEGYSTALIGKAFGRLTVVDNVAPGRWLCRCACGRETISTTKSLNAGKATSCGCYRAEVSKASIGQTKDALGQVDGTTVSYLISIMKKNRAAAEKGDRVIGISRLAEKAGYVYQVAIAFQDKDYYLGRYRSYDAAVQVRLEAEEKLWLPMIRKWESEQEGTQT